MLPVVLHHGFLGTDELRLGPIRLGYWRGIDRAIVQRGHPLIVTRVHPSSSIENRARQLKESLLRQLEMVGRVRGERPRVVLMAHSMGGLDARYAVAKLGLDDAVAAVLTVSTPHRGSPVADWAVKHVGQRLGVMRLLALLRLDWRAVIDLTTYRCTEFNEQVRDVPGVGYFSVSTAAPWTSVPAFALSSWAIVRAAEGENDGLVSASSAVWGEHLGTWPMNHWQGINRRPLLRIRSQMPNAAGYWVEALERVVRRLEGEVGSTGDVGGHGEQARRLNEEGVGA